MNYSLSKRKYIQLSLGILLIVLMTLVLIKGTVYKADQNNQEQMPIFHIFGYVINEDNQPQGKMLIAIGGESGVVSNEAGYYETLIQANEKDQLKIKIYNSDNDDKFYSIKNLPEGLITIDPGCDDIQMQDEARSMCEQAEIKNMNLNLHIKSN